MYRKIIVFIFLFMNFGFSQISVNDIEKLSNSQLDLIREELQSSNLNELDQDSNIVVNTENVSIKAPKSSPKNTFFGYDYFNRDINFFDNIPTPPDFKLGPGDEIILSLWGETNSRENFVINKEGLIYYENIGFINLSNKTIEEAESVLVNELSRIYSTLKDKNNQTQLMLELGKLKSINVYFSGRVKSPGIHLIHPFSDVFSSIIQSGGIRNEGSLRKVEIIRSNKIIAVVDFYSFFISGKNNFSNVRILDGDIIHIPEVSIRASIEGDIINGGLFELIEDESIAQLINYAGGLKATASSNAIIDRITPLSKRSSDDNARTSQNINFNEFSKIIVNDGDNIKILSIGDVSTKVELFGRVKYPGEYAASSSLKDVLDIAGGFEDPLYRKTIRDDEIIVLRKDENQFYGLEFKIPYKDSDNFTLVPDDKIFVYENTLYDNLFSVKVEGEVNKRGNFQLKKDMTVQDVINLAEGFSPLANQSAIIVSESFTSIDNEGNVIEETRSVNNATLDFKLTNRSTVNVLPLENVVSVVGNVYSPGLITYSKGKTINRYINLAGGPKPNTLSNRMYVKRANGQIKKVSMLRGLGVIVRPGDTIFVPVDEDPKDFDITSFIADLATTLANIAAILVVIDNTNN